MKILRWLVGLFKPRALAQATYYEPTEKVEMKARRLAYLLTGFMRDNLTQDEHDELDEWVGQSDRNIRLFEELTDENKIEQALKLLEGDGEGLVKMMMPPSTMAAV